MSNPTGAKQFRADLATDAMQERVRKLESRSMVANQRLDSAANAFVKYDKRLAAFADSVDEMAQRVKGVVSKHDINEIHRRINVLVEDYNEMDQTLCLMQLESEPPTSQVVGGWVKLGGLIGVVAVGLDWLIRQLM